MLMMAPTVQGGCDRGKMSKVQAVEYRVWCRLQLQKRWKTIRSEDGDAAGRIEALLRGGRHLGNWTNHTAAVI